MGFRLSVGGFGRSKLLHRPYGKSRPVIGHDLAHVHPAIGDCLNIESKYPACGGRERSALWSEKVGLVVLLYALV